MAAIKNTGARTVVLPNPPSREVRVRDFCCSVRAKGSCCRAPICGPIGNLKK